MENQPKTFTLNAYEEYYFEFDAKIFAALSKTGKNLEQQGIFQYDIQRHYSKETLESFVAACNLEPFKVTTNNAFELLDLAKELEVNNIIEFVQNYITSKNLKRNEENDEKTAKTTDFSINDSIASK